MKIDARCHTCGRRFVLSQIGPESDAPGRCPFCGARFGRHYTTVLAETAEETEAAAEHFIAVLRRLEDMETGFDVDVDGLLREVSDQVRGPEAAAS